MGSAVAELARRRNAMNARERERLGRWRRMVMLSYGLHAEFVLVGVGSDFTGSSQPVICFLLEKGRRKRRGKEGRRGKKEEKRSSREFIIFRTRYELL